MKKLMTVSFLAIVFLLLLAVPSCGGKSEPSAFSDFEPPSKIKLWATLDNNPNSSPVTTLTSAQTTQASYWASAIKEESIQFKVNIYASEKDFVTWVSNVRIESSKPVLLGTMSNALKPGTYIFRAHSGGFGTVVGSMQITVTP
ncbi:MAG: hypothetical protein FJ006_05470 [Chloroflexi bacterium]|nr:hypothetical protein [Chloroflexota bacterium]